MIFKSKELAELAAELTGAYQRRSSAPALCGENAHHPPLTPIVSDRRVVMSCLTCEWVTTWLPHEVVGVLELAWNPSPGVNVPM